VSVTRSFFWQFSNTDAVTATTMTPKNLGKVEEEG
jgi:hypothetical protein